jgi:hypothetical protein
MKNDSVDSTERSGEVPQAPLLSIERPSVDVSPSEMCELAGALEIRRILEEIKQVAALYGSSSPFASGWQNACEEIFFRATGCKWHMDEDAERFLGRKSEAAVQDVAEALRSDEQKN